MKAQSIGDLTDPEFQELTECDGDLNKILESYLSAFIERVFLKSKEAEETDNEETDNNNVQLKDILDAFDDAFDDASFDCESTNRSSRVTEPSYERHVARGQKRKTNEREREMKQRKAKHSRGK